MATPTETSTEISSIEKLEEIRQRPAIESIKASSEEGKYKYDYAVRKINSDDKKWNKSFYIASIIIIMLISFSIYLTIHDKVDIGIGVLSATISGFFGFIGGLGACKSKS